MTLDQVRQFIKSGAEFKVILEKTKQDITNKTVAQVIIDAELKTLTPLDSNVGIEAIRNGVTPIDARG